MIKQRLRNFILDILPPALLEELIAEEKIKRCVKVVTMGDKSKFYETAKVFNIQNDSSKIVIGNNTHIRAELLVFPFGGKIQIGSNSYIGEGTRIWSAENIFIGNDVLISHNCNIIDTDSHEINYIERAERVKSIVATGHPSQKGTVQTAPIYISDHAWLSYNVSILKGVKIGKGAIVAAGSVVTKDVADFTVVAGNPAVFIKNIQ